MPYIPDTDLNFLQSCNQDDLDVLVGYLMKKSPAKSNWSPRLQQNDRFLKYFPDHTKYWNLIAAELQFAGGNTFANMLTGEGVVYRKILFDVCRKLKVKFNKQQSSSDIEALLLEKVLKESVENMPDEELKILVDNLNIKTTSVSKPAMIAAVQAAIKTGVLKPQFIAKPLATALARLVIGKGSAKGAAIGLQIGLKKGLGKFIAVFTGPIGWAATVTWLLSDFARPAFRVTIPAVIHISYLRLKYSDGEGQ